jgi:ferritin-like metal-binding protein YciE
MKFDTLKDALVHELQDLYNAEKQLVSALPKLIDAVSHASLKEAIGAHLDETKNHVLRLEKIFNSLGINGSSETCEAMKGLLEEADELISAEGDPSVKDALLIGAAQRVEHYEMAAYGTARSFAQSLGLGDVASLLQATLDEEGAADKKLTTIAEDGWMETGVNTDAMSGSESHHHA